MTSLKTSIKTITYLSDIGCLEIQGASLAGYMTSYFIGGAAGSLISASAWQHGGWAGVCLAGATIALVNLLVWWRGFHRQEAAN
ncbi:major facilitator superfamily protein [Escherichia coli]|nr:major facilitator superfamily protein [Escherichia coli]